MSTISTGALLFYTEETGEKIEVKRSYMTEQSSGGGSGAARARDTE